jgi:hypothetical protein
MMEEFACCLALSLRHLLLLPLVLVLVVMVLLLPAPLPLYNRRMRWSKCRLSSALEQGVEDGRPPARDCSYTQQSCSSRLASPGADAANCANRCSPSSPARRRGP